MAVTHRQVIESTTAAGGVRTKVINDFAWPAVQVTLSEGATLAELTIDIQLAGSEGWVEAESYSALAESIIYISPAAAVRGIRVSWDGLAGGTLSAVVAGQEASV